MTWKRWGWGAVAAVLAIVGIASVTGPYWAVSNFSQQMSLAVGGARTIHDVALAGGPPILAAGLLSGAPSGMAAGAIHEGGHALDVSVRAVHPGHYAVPAVWVAYGADGIPRVGFIQHVGYVWVTGRYPWSRQRGTAVSYKAPSQARRILMALAHGRAHHMTTVLSTVGQLRAVAPRSWAPGSGAAVPAELLAAQAGTGWVYEAVDLVDGRNTVWRSPSLIPLPSSLGTRQLLSPAPG